MAIKNFNERKNYYKNIYGDYQIIINNISLETAEKVLNEDAMDGEIFIQLLSQKGNTINRMIWTSKNFFDFGKNQLLAGNFPNNSNEVLIDIEAAKNFGTYYYNAIGKNIEIEGKTYNISGLITKDNFVWSSNPTAIYMFNINCWDEYSRFYDASDTFSLIIKSSKLSIPMLLKVKLCVKYHIDPLMIEYNESLLEALQITGLFIPNGIDNILETILLIFSVICFIYLLFILLSNKDKENKSTAENVCKITFALVLLTSINFSIFNCYFSSAYNDYQCSNYNLKISWNELNKGESSKAVDIQNGEDYSYKYIITNTYLPVESLSKQYSKYLRHIATSNAVALDKGEYISVSSVLICENSNSLETNIFKKANDNYCYCTDLTISSEQTRFPLGLKKNMQINFLLSSSTNEEIHSTVITDIISSPVLSGENFSGMPVFFVDEETFSKLSVNQRIISTVYTKNIEGYTNICGSNVTDLQTCYQMQKNNKITNICEIFLLTITFIAVIFTDTYYACHKFHFFIFMILYFAEVIISDLVIYALLIRKQSFFNFSIPAIQLLIPLVVIFFLIIKHLLKNNFLKTN